MRRFARAVFVLTLVGWTTSRMVLAGGEDKPEKPATTSISMKFAAIRSEYEAAQQQAATESDKGKSDFESWKIYTKLMPDEAAFSEADGRPGRDGTERSRRPRHPSLGAGQAGHGARRSV